MRYLVGAGVGTLALGALLWFELETSTAQSIALSRYAAGIEHWLDVGPNDALRYPDSGPFDLRAGYSSMPVTLQRLEKRGFAV